MTKAAEGLELWGGHECTVNRVGDAFMDQTVLTGHHDRPQDLELFAGLGVTALRYPVLWERVAPEDPRRLDWAWTDGRLAKLQSLGVRPIAGLVHHGSGPRYTSLLDDGFAPGLASFAREAARRYPWVKDWTPVNEPLTTARFSALYGLWYPHLKDEPAFWAALLNQIDAIRLSMAAIREVIPDARLIQTEDLGRTYSTEITAEQAAFDNHRRWLTWDLLTGAVTPGHPLWPRLVRFGFKERLAAMAGEPCPPDIIGINHYVTSDRFLDHRLDRYPPDRHGGNDFVPYADVEAVRVLEASPRGLALAIEEAWDRYRLPLAITECHLGCTREEQVRWLAEAWATAAAAREAGVDLRALTAWSLLGAYDWDSLLTNPRGRYESGAFDVRSGDPRPTALAAALKALPPPAEPCPIRTPLGWWRRDVRLEYDPACSICDTGPFRGSDADLSARTQPVLILGATGTLGRALARGCAHRALSHVLTDRAGLSLDDPGSIAAALDRHQPWAVVNAAGWVRVDEAESDPEGCLRANKLGAIALGSACRERGIPLVTFSSDLVFDGAMDRPYEEGDPTRPLNVYGRSKAEAEEALLAMGGNLVIRTAAFFSPHDPHNFAAKVIETLRRGEVVTAPDDQVVSPTYVPDLVDATLDLLIDGETGIWHLANAGGLSWRDFGRAVAARAGLDDALVRGVATRELGLPAARPRWSVLGSARGIILPSLEDALDRLGAHLARRPRPAARRQSRAA